MTNYKANDFPVSNDEILDEIVNVQERLDNLKNTIERDVYNIISRYLIAQRSATGDNSYTRYITQVQESMGYTGPNNPAIHDTGITWQIDPDGHQIVVNIVCEFSDRTVRIPLEYFVDRNAFKQYEYKSLQIKKEREEKKARQRFKEVKAQYKKLSARFGEE